MHSEVFGFVFKHTFGTEDLKEGAFRWSNVTELSPFELKNLTWPTFRHIRIKKKALVL
jgi:hypothetical protein